MTEPNALRASDDSSPGEALLSVASSSLGSTAVSPAMPAVNGNGAVALPAPATAGFASRAASITKRAIDLLLSIVLIVALAPLMLVVALLIKLDSPGPIFFRQRRLGRDMREFNVVKFRTMHTGVSPELHRLYIAELAKRRAGYESGELQKLTHDPRVTRVGRVLRRISIDELPQLINVLAGEMSLVGPRPALDYELEHYAPAHFDRFAVRPGLTGLWQVSGRSQLGFTDMLELDSEYARTASFMTDLRILARTPLAAIRHAA